MPEGLDRIRSQFYNKIGETLIPEGTGPVHHPVVPAGKLGLDELHDAGYGFSIFHGFDEKMEVIIHDGIGNEFEVISFQGLVEHIMHQVLDLFGVHEGFFLDASGYGMVGCLRQADP